MGCTEIGIDGERKAREVLKNHNFEIFQADWIIKTNDNKYFIVEVKNKSGIFKKMNPITNKEDAPFDGHGLDSRQIYARLQFQKITGIRTIFMVIDEEQHKVIWNFLDELCDVAFETRNHIMIFPLERFLPEEKLMEIQNGT